MALLTQFGISEGAARVALSRMVDKGELLNQQGDYLLAGALLDRQLRQDQSRSPSHVRWAGVWEQAVVLDGPTSASARRLRRQSLLELKLAELREGVWVRPANLDPLRPPGQSALNGADIVWGTFKPTGDPAALANRLWDLGGWAANAREMIAELGELLPRLGGSDDVLEPGFVLSASVLRHFLADPDLPSNLLPASWPGTELMVWYDKFDAAYRAHLRNFFAVQAA